jgi:hypothetical protein
MTQPPAGNCRRLFLCACGTKGKIDSRPLVESQIDPNRLARLVKKMVS